jgi:salicylate hydroxylase
MWTDERPVAVVGAGIAGLTLALALHRAGLRCEVFEQAEWLGEVGAGVQVAPNAARLLHRLGLAGHLARVAVRPVCIQMSRWSSGETMMRLPLGTDCERVFGAPYYTVHRADLHAGLLALLPAGTIHIGHRLVRAEECTGGVELEFAGGRRVTAAVAVGADGIHSVLRGQLVRDEPRFSGQTIYRGLVPADRVPSMAEPRVQLWLGPGQHCVAYPVSGGRLVSFGATVPVAGAPNGSRYTESWSSAGRVEELAAAYRGWHPAVQELVAAADAVGRWALHDRDAIPRWSSRRCTLIGDAAHPMLPFLAQGANQAVEDAVALAACLRAAAPGGVGGVEPALRRYEALRQPRTEEIQRRSRDNTRSLHLPDGDGQRRRDGLLAEGADLETQRWLYGHDAELAAADGGLAGSNGREEG